MTIVGEPVNSVWVLMQSWEVHSNKVITHVSLTSVNLSTSFSRSANTTASPPQHSSPQRPHLNDSLDPAICFDAGIISRLLGGGDAACEAVVPMKTDWAYGLSAWLLCTACTISSPFPQEVNVTVDLCRSVWSSTTDVRCLYAWHLPLQGSPAWLRSRYITSVRSRYSVSAWSSTRKLYLEKNVKTVLLKWEASIAQHLWTFNVLLKLLGCMCKP